MNTKYIKENANDTVHHLEYNAERPHLIIPEYGRHLQKLIDQATAIEDDEKRNKAAKYIIDIRRVPLPIKRWGFLPTSVQYFLQTDYSKVVDPNNNKYLRSDRTTTTLLRFGVENSSKKSFVACIADFYASKRNEPVPTIENMCERLASSVSIDLFLKYHNGSLAAIFRPKVVDIDQIDYTLYESTEFMKRLDLGNETHMDFIYDTIAAYENFRTFLTNPESYIDHTYLWDIVCSPNPALFTTGCNLAIVRIRNVDMTDDIEVLCPTSVYSPILFDSKKETLVLIQHGDFFEPVYLFHSKVEKGRSTMTIQKSFVEERSPIKDVLQTIRHSIQGFCPPKMSLPAVYKFKRALPAEPLWRLLLEQQFVPLAQIFNYQGKVVGLWIKYRNGGVYIPCFPSPPLPELPAKFMDDDHLWMKYRDTLDVLQKVYERSKGAILCRPVFKIMEDDQIVGVLTETNQFIALSEPEEPVEDEIPLLKDENFLVADKKIAQSKTPDPLRTQTIRKIRLETQFYGAFRTTVRILLNDPAQQSYKNQITGNSRENIELLLRTMCNSFVSFREFEPEVLDSLEEISDCFLNPEEKKYCVLQNGQYQLILPRTHLVSGKDNSALYYARISDELARYKRIQLFMMNAKTYLNLTNTEYKINGDEMLLLESLITSDYLKSLEPYQHGNTLITYETANPVLTQKYGNEISLDAQRNMVTKDTHVVHGEDAVECVKVTQSVIGKATTSEWKKFFPSKSQEMILHETVRCSYYPIMYVYQQLHSTFLTREQIKSKLIQEYAKIGDEIQKIHTILRNQGKRTMIDDIQKGKYTLETAIMTEVYCLTVLDIWVLASALRLPIILFHQNRLKGLFGEGANSVNWLRITEGAAYYFVRVPTEKDHAGNYIPNYSIVKPAVLATAAPMVELIQHAKKTSFFSLTEYLEKINIK